MTILRFIGDWSPWLSLAVGVMLAAGAWLLYRRQLHGRGSAAAHGLPLLRGLALVLLIFLLAGPVLKHRRVVGEIGKVLVCVDASQSMSVGNEAMEPERKVLLMSRLGLLTPEALDQHLVQGMEALRRLRAAAADGLAAVGDAKALKTATTKAHEAAAEAVARLGKAGSSAGPPAAPAGYAVREVWFNVPGWKVEELRAAPAFQGPASLVENVSTLAGPVDWNDSYGARFRGYLHPPVEGDYVFWITADDTAELWLSSDATPDNRKRSAAVTFWKKPDAWEEAAEQRSQPVRLKANTAYYFEVLMKENQGGDHVAVGWQIPNGPLERPIPGNRLSPYIGSNAAIFSQEAEEMRKVLLEPCRAAAERQEGENTPLTLAALGAVETAAAAWEERCRQILRSQAAAVLKRSDQEIRENIKRFDSLSRWQRCQSLLLQGERPLLRQLAKQHHVVLTAIGAKEPIILWDSLASRRQSGDEIPRALAGEPNATQTDLSSGILRLTADCGTAQRTAVVLFSDGRANQGAPLENIAQVLGSKGIAIHAVGMGSLTSPPDLAVVEVISPQRVGVQDRVKGRIIFTDFMLPGQEFCLRIDGDGEVLWEKRFTTSHAGKLEASFDFTIANLVKARMAKSGVKLHRLSLPLWLRVSIPPVAGEARRDNNSRDLPLRVIVEPRRALLVDGRPRWDLRYLRNFLARDAEWEVTALIAEDRTNAGRWRPDQVPAEFPQNAADLFNYHIAIIGDISPACLSTTECELLRDFVARRGAGLLFIDGCRSGLAGLAETALGELLPITYAKRQISPAIKLRLTAQGKSNPFMSLAGDDKANLALWERLTPPSWLPPINAKAGTAVWLEAEVKDGVLPLVIGWRYGAGQALYVGTDETWRWRYPMADAYQEKFWRQIIAWAAEPPFAVRDEYTALDVSAMVVHPGESIDIRARLRGADSLPLLAATAWAEISREAAVVATVPLVAEENQGGLYRGRSAALPSGRYRVRVRAEGLPETSETAYEEFEVKIGETGELAELSCHEAMLHNISRSSRGAYLREEECQRLSEMLKPLSQGRIEETETVLWQSGWWFAAVVALLAAEWLWRKRSGLL